MLVLDHVAGLTLMSGAALYFVGQDAIGAPIYLFAWLFAELFFTGALILGLGGAFVSSIIIGVNFIKGTILNGSSCREEFQRLVFSIVELFAGILVLTFIGFPNFMKFPV